MKDFIQKAGCVFVSAVLSLLFFQNLSTQTVASEPRWEEKSLSAWLRGFTDDPGTNYEKWYEAYRAVHQIGTNAVPTLLGMFRSQDTNLCVQAACGFQALGEDAVFAVPELIHIHETNSFPWARSEIVRAMCSFGPQAKQAVPLLVRATADPEGSVRNNAACALGRIHRDPDIAIPALIKCLDDSETGVRCNAADALASFGPSAKAAVPKLNSLLKDESHIGPQAPVSASASKAIKAIDPVTAAKLELK